MSMTMGDHFRAILAIARDEHKLFATEDTGEMLQWQDAAIAVGLSRYFAQVAQLQVHPKRHRHVQELQTLMYVIGASVNCPDHLPEDPPCTE